MNLANRISLFRIILVPCFVASLVYYTPARDHIRYVSLAFLLVAIASDAVDGLVARSKRQQSQLGAVLDPIADRVLILSALISLSTIRALPDWMRIPAWFNLVVMSRDAIIITGTLLLFGFTGKLTVNPSRLGKWTIAAQMAVIVAVLLRFPLKIHLLLATAVLTVASGLHYLRVGSRLLGPHG